MPDEDEDFIPEEHAVDESMLDDSMLDLDKDVRVTQGGKELFSGRAPRSRETIERVLGERYDPQSAFTAEVRVTTCTPPAT